MGPPAHAGGASARLESGEGGTKVELDKAWERTKRLHSQRFGEADLNGRSIHSECRTIRERRQGSIYGSKGRPTRFVGESASCTTSASLVARNEPETVHKPLQVIGEEIAQMLTGGLQQLIRIARLALSCMAPDSAVRYDIGIEGA